MKILKLNSKSFAKIIRKVIKEIKDGKVIILPTDTVYGLICDATNKKAVRKIFKIKKRPKNKPLPIFVKDMVMAKKIAEINKKQENFIKKVWPGKVTVRLKRTLRRGPGQARIKLYGVDKETIALRIPKYKFLNSLLKEINIPLAQTSVNISGQPTITDVKDILKIFKNNKYQPDLAVYNNGSKNCLPSKIFDLTKNKIKILRK